jgi:hypothetical protein
MKISGTKAGFWLVLLFVFGVSIGYVMFNKSPNGSCPILVQTAPAAVELVQDPSDTVRNPYAPPVRQHCEFDYAQLGYLSHGNDKRPLFGKRTCHRDKWFYYTEVNGIKLPVEFKNKKCTASPGCDTVACRDTVRVDGVDYTVNLYETDMFTYNPFLQ